MTLVAVSGQPYSIQQSATKVAATRHIFVLPVRKTPRTACSPWREDVRGAQTVDFGFLRNHGKVIPRPGRSMLRPYKAPLLLHSLQQLPDLRRVRVTLDHSTSRARDLGRGLKTPILHSAVRDQGRGHTPRFGTTSKRNAAHEDVRGAQIVDFGFLRNHGKVIPRPGRSMLRPYKAPLLLQSLQQLLDLRQLVA